LYYQFLWDFIGYSLVYGKSSGGIIGSFEYGVLLNTPYDKCIAKAPRIPAAAFAIFQMMFAVITPLLMTGAYAERMRFLPFIVFTVLWEILVYYPLAHWIWGGGWLATHFEVLDFAGGIVIHTSAGVGGLVSALVLGRRKDFELYRGDFPPSNLPLAAIGAAFLWMGWFGFNAGSALSAGSVATSTIVSTQVAASLCGCIWMILSIIRNKPGTIPLINGVIAGLAGITPASGYINTQWSLLLGAIVGASSYFSVILFKNYFKIDDALDVSSVHGVTGILGSLFIGFFSQKSLFPTGQSYDGVFYGNGKLIGGQVLAVTVAIIWSGSITLLLWVLLKLVFRNLRVTPDEEIEGLDAVEHGENAYHDLLLTSNAESQPLIFENINGTKILSSA